jgi:hypothetical protein
MTSVELALEVKVLAVSVKPLELLCVVGKNLTAEGGDV